MPVVCPLCGPDREENKNIVPVANRKQKVFWFLASNRSAQDGVREPQQEAWCALRWE